MLSRFRHSEARGPWAASAVVVLESELEAIFAGLEVLKRYLAQVMAR